MRIAQALKNPVNAGVEALAERYPAVDQWREGVGKRMAQLLRDPGGFMSEAARDVTPTPKGLIQALAQADTPEAQQARQRMQDIAMAGITAYHGSPHKFDKFDMSKVGTGEGAQAYGHGLYFAENPQIAKYYAEALKQPDDIRHLSFGGVPVYQNGRPVDYSPWPKGAPQNYRPLPDDYGRALLQEDLLINEQALRKAHAEGGERDLFVRAREIIQDRLNSAKVEQPDIVPFLEKTLSNLNKNIGNAARIKKGASHIYKADIPDEAVAKMLDWDKPLSQQPESVKAILSKKLEGARVQKSDVVTGYDLLDSSGKWILSRPRPFTVDELEGATIYKVLTGGQTQDETSGILRSMGIPGIRYLDQGSRGAGQGTYNYVVFDDQLPKILGRE